MEILLNSSSSLMEAVKSIELSRRRTAVVVDSGNKLLGTLTDGDVRRCLLSGGSLDTTVNEAMNKNPVFVDDGSPSVYILDLMRKHNILAVPVVDKSKGFLRLVHISELDFSANNSDNLSKFEFAVIMAGGEGMRLRPITSTIPKPMVDIAGAPLLERQVESLAKAGLKRIYLSVNYLSHVIEDYFEDGHRFGIEIRYLRENEKLGTAGSLSLLPEVPKKPIIVMNGDILTTTDFASFYTFHCSHEAAVTIAAVDYRVSIPYGVINVEGAYATKIVEKPSQRFLCNAGIYALSPKVLESLVVHEHLNMTDIVSQCFDSGLSVSVFPVHEYWSDIGTPDDLDKARMFLSGSVK